MNTDDDVLLDEAFEVEEDDMLPELAFTAYPTAMQAAWLVEQAAAFEDAR